jgi:hypothetical protein
MHNDFLQVPDASFYFRSLAFCPVCSFLLMSILVLACCAMGFVATGRPKLDADSQGFAARGTEMHSNLNALHLLQDFKWAGVSPSPPAPTPTWHECSYCSNAIDIIGSTSSLVEEVDEDTPVQPPPNILHPTFLKGLCEVEEKVANSVAYLHNCAPVSVWTSTPSCCPAQSIARLTARVTALPCNAISDANLSRVLGVLSSGCASNASSPSFWLAPTAASRGTERDSGSWVDPGGRTLEQEICWQEQTLRKSLLDMTFSGTSGQYVRSKICLPAMPPSADAESLDPVTQLVLDNHEAWSKEAEVHSGLSVTFFSERLFEAYKTQRFRRDLTLAAAAFGIVVAVGWVQSGSVVVALLSTGHSILAWPLTYAIYVGVLGHEWMPCCNYLSLFYLLAFGVNESVAFVDAWTEAPDCPVAPRLTWAWRRIQWPSMASGVTSAIAAYTNCLSDAPPLRLFGRFIALAFALKWLLFVVWVPTIFGIRYVSIQNCWNWACTKRSTNVKHEAQKRCLCCRPVAACVRSAPRVVARCPRLVFFLMAIIGGLLTLVSILEAEHVSSEFRLFQVDDTSLQVRHL